MLMLRSVAAIAVGYFVSALLVVATFLVLGAAFPTVFPQTPDAPLPPAPWIVLVGFLGGVYAVLGGYWMARIAGRREFTHAAVLGGIMLVLAVGSVLALPGTREGAWLDLVFAAVGVAGVFIGARLRKVALRAR